MKVEDMIFNVRRLARMIEPVDELVPTAAAMYGLCELIDLQSKQIASIKALSATDAQKAAELSLSLCWAIESAGIGEQITQCSMLANELRALLLKIEEKAKSP